MKYGSLIALIFLISACVPIGPGKNFERVNEDALRLGVDTRENVTALLGPFRWGYKAEFFGTEVDAATYSYSPFTGETVYENVKPTRGYVFYFYEDKLVGYVYTSSFIEDSTDFDDAKISEIKENVTSEIDVVRDYGKADGVYSYPLTRKPGDITYVYQYSHTEITGSAAPFAGGFTINPFAKTLKITYNEDSTVKEVDYERIDNFESLRRAQKREEHGY